MRWATTAATFFRRGSRPSRTRPITPQRSRGWRRNWFAAPSRANSPQEWEALANHAARMADAYESEPRLSAWLHVERAQNPPSAGSDGLPPRGAPSNARSSSTHAWAPYATRSSGTSLPTPTGSVIVRLLDQEGEDRSQSDSAPRGSSSTLRPSRRRASGDSATACSLLRTCGRASADSLRRSTDECSTTSFVCTNRRVAFKKRRGRGERASGSSPKSSLRSYTSSAHSPMLRRRPGTERWQVADIQRAIALTTGDLTLVDALDRLLLAEGKHDQRIAMWAARSGAERGRHAARGTLLGRAAQVCVETGRTGDAVRHLRGGMGGRARACRGTRVTRPLARARAGGAPGGRARSRRPLRTSGRRRARSGPQDRVPGEDRALHLGGVELLGDPCASGPRLRADPRARRRAPERRPRASARSRAHGRRADRSHAHSSTRRRSPRTRPRSSRYASEPPPRAGQPKDPARAMQIVREVLLQDPAHAGALALETRLEEDCGSAGRSPPSRSAPASTLRQRQRTRSACGSRWRRSRTRGSTSRSMRSNRSKKRGRSTPRIPFPPVKKIARLPRRARRLHALFATRRSASRCTRRRRTNAPTTFTRAAELDELVLGDDAAAARTYQRALADAPHDDLAADRLARVMVRRAQQPGGGNVNDLTALLARRIEHASPEAAGQMSFELAAFARRDGTGNRPAPSRSSRRSSPKKATTCRPCGCSRCCGAARGIWRRSRARARQGGGRVQRRARARLGALWSLAPRPSKSGNSPWATSTSTYRRVLELDPTDPGALESHVASRVAPTPGAGWTLARGRPSSEPCARSCPFASDEDTRLSLQLRLDLILDKAAEESSGDERDELLREALTRYRRCAAHR